MELRIELGLLRFVRFEVPLLPPSPGAHPERLFGTSTASTRASRALCAGLVWLWMELFRQPASRVGPKGFNEGWRRYDVCCRNPGLKGTAGNHVVCESWPVMLCSHMYQRSFRIGSKSFVPFIALSCFCNTSLKIKIWVRQCPSSGSAPRVVCEDQGDPFPLVPLVFTIAAS